MKAPLKIGLTGGMASGKSLVLRFLAQKGIPVLQTDQLGHQLLKDKKASAAIYRRFGKEVFGRGGRVDRKKLGLAVFRKAAKLRQLNALLHPVILNQVREWTRQQASRPLSRPLLVVEVPLLYESRFDHYFDGVLCVSAPRELRRKRLLRKGFSLSQIRLREKSQWTQSQKDKRADWVILNRKGIKELKYGVDRWLRQLAKEGRA